MKRLTAIFALALAACAFAAPKVKAPPSFAKDGELLLEPTYCCCSVEFGADKPIEGLALEWRSRGTRDPTGGRGATALPSGHAGRVTVVRIAAFPVISVVPIRGRMGSQKGIRR